MLNVDSISRSYGDFRAVNDVSFDVGQGEVVGLLGHNGAGKTTIMKMLSGYLEPDEGYIQFNGTAINSKPASLQRELGYLPEHLPVYPELSVASYLDYAAELKGLRAQEKRLAIRRAVQETELGEKLLSPIDTLSRGMKQRVGVAQAILGSPSLLILDEPTNGLDPGQTESMRHLIRTISQHATVILSTHIMQEVEAVCDRALIVRRGMLAVDRKLNDLTRDRVIRLNTTATDQRVRSALQSVPGIDDITNVSAPIAENAGHWLLSVAATAEVSATIALCANELVNSQVPVMGIGIEERDLQSLFLEVSHPRHAEDSQRSSQSEQIEHDNPEAAHVA